MVLSNVIRIFKHDHTVKRIPDIFTLQKCCLSKTLGLGKLLKFFEDLPSVDKEKNVYLQICFAK